MLNFNPYFRPSAKDLLKNEIFDKVRHKLLEAPMEFKISLQIDQEKYAYDFEDESKN